jgi:hypothetical protein
MGVDFKSVCRGCVIHSGVFHCDVCQLGRVPEQFVKYNKVAYLTCRSFILHREQI